MSPLCIINSPRILQRSTLRILKVFSDCKYRLSCVKNYSSHSSGSAYSTFPCSKLLKLEEKRSYGCKIFSGQGFNVLRRYLSVNHFPSHAKVSKRESIIKSNRDLDSVTNQLEIDQNEWETVYRMNYIIVARVVQRMKLYQTALTCCLVLPGTLGLYLNGAVPVEAVAFTVGTSTFACGMLYLMGQFCSRLIGILYVSRKDPSIARVAHLNFWGKREDQIISKKDFVPFSELDDNMKDAYINVKFYSDPEVKLHLSLRLGTVYNVEKFEELFGSEYGVIFTKKEAKEK